MNTEYLTQEKFDQFTKELQYLKYEKRTEIAKALEYAKSLGDLSENAEYQEARDTQGRTEDRINYLEALLRSAEIVTPQTTGAIAVGSKVSVERTKDGLKKQFIFVSSEESDAALGKISIRSPLGVAAFGKKKGESFTFETPAGAVTYTVLDIQ